PVVVVERRLERGQRGTEGRIAAERSGPQRVEQEQHGTGAGLAELARRCVREQTELIDDATDRNIRRLDHQRLPPAVQRPQRFSDDTLVICRERRVLRDRLEELKAASNLQLVLRRAEDER